MLKKVIVLTSAALIPVLCSYSQSNLGIPNPVPVRVTLNLPNGRAKDIPPGPYKPSWESIRANYKVPQWFADAKFGIMMHWGLYSVAAHQSEWYPKHMYNDAEVRKWHTEKFGPIDKFGYKDFIPLFKAEKYNPDAWALLFKKSGAKYIVPTAEHHDGFALYDSDLTKWDAKDMGPKRDLIGDMAVAVRKQGLKFGVSNHRIEHWDFMYPVNQTEKNDLFNPAYADFYGPPQKPAGYGVSSTAFKEEWLRRCQELVDKYKPDMVWFDNGVNPRMVDSVKLRFAAYYYNSALTWGKEVSISTKSNAYLAGSIMDYERQGRAPKEITAFPWQVDDPVLYRFGYTENSPIATAKSVIDKLVENVCRNGALLLNISPKADGTIPDDQQKLLLQIGAWLDVNGEAIYSTRTWKKYGEGDVRFTKKDNILYATSLKKPAAPIVIASLPLSYGKVSKVSMPAYKGKITFSQNEQGLSITPPSDLKDDYAFTFKIEGLDLAK